MPFRDQMREQEQEDHGQVANASQEVWADNFLWGGLALHLLQLNTECLSIAICTQQTDTIIISPQCWRRCTQSTNWPANTTKSGEELRWSQECTAVSCAKARRAVSAVSAPGPSQLCAPCLQHATCQTTYLLIYNTQLINTTQETAAIICYNSRLTLHGYLLWAR